MNAEFVHLRCFSSYSLLEGALKIEDIVSLCKKHKMPAIAITDSSNLFGSMEFSLECSSSGVQPIIGCTVKVNLSSLVPIPFSSCRLVLIAKNQTGYTNLLKVVSNSFISGQPSEPIVSLTDLELFSEGLICLTGGEDGPLNFLLSQKQSEKSREVLARLRDIFVKNLYIELQRIGAVGEKEVDEELIDLAYMLNIPVVATNKVMFSDMSMYEAHDVLLCIAQGKYQVEEDRIKSHPEYYFKTPREMIRLFKDIPEAIENTIKIAQSCSVKSNARDPLLPSLASEGSDEGAMFRAEVLKGLENRLADLEVDRAAYISRMNYELEVITSMKFAGYFLIVSDFIRWSKQNGIPVGPGRGSGAGSVVAWSLNITDLDPIKFGLVFERFLNPERISMPDFDIDFCQERRDEVIGYVQNKYGKEKVAQIITFGKLQAKAVLRDVGRVLQIPYAVVDRISKLVPFNAVNPVTLADAIKLEPMLREAREKDELIKRLIEIGLKLEGLNRHASTHAAGIVIADRDLVELVPVYKDSSSSDMLVVQYSMKYAEISGLVKFDFLGLKTLTVIAKTVELVNRLPLLNHVNIETIPLDDKKTFALLAKGDTTGVFQFEGSGMKDSLRKMRPSRIEDLMALSALFRPGPMDNIPTYIACKAGQQKPDYLHPSLEEILKETYGVIIYQEQVLQIAQVLAGYSLGKADLLRRAMGKKIKKEMDDQREMFVAGAVKCGHDPEQASKIFDLVAKFAGYGFNRAHAACYAFISYQTAYLKANYPLEFITASLNLEIDDTDKINIFIQEAKNMGIEILPPDINKSECLFSVEQGKIRYGLAALKNVGQAATLLMIQERNKKEFNDIFDFTSRVDQKILNKRQMESLIKAGAFDSLYPSRSSLFHSINSLSVHNNAIKQELSSNQINLFGKMEVRNPEIKQVAEWGEKEKIKGEFEAFGFYLNSHPLKEFSGILSARNIKNWQYIQEEMPIGSGSINFAAVPLSSKTRSSPRGRYVTCLMSDCFGNFEVSIFNDSLLEKSLDLIKNNVPIFIEADIKKDEGGVRITANKIMPLEELLGEGFRSLKLWINHAAAVSLAKEHIAKLPQGKATIELTLNINSKHHVVVELPQKYNISMKDKELLETFDGIEKVLLS